MNTKIINPKKSAWHYCHTVGDNCSLLVIGLKTNKEITQSKACINTIKNKL